MKSEMNAFAVAEPDSSKVLLSNDAVNFRGKF